MRVVVDLLIRGCIGKSDPRLAIGSASSNSTAKARKGEASSAITGAYTLCSLQLLCYMLCILFLY